jgi:hypothetical protein
MFATGAEFAKLSIQLQQHDQQPNAYFAAAKFLQADTYRLKAISEYRAYFWELPIVHAYRPHEFKSQNKLIVRPSVEKKNVPFCNLKSNTTNLVGTWIDKTAYESNHGQDLFFSYENSENDYSMDNKVFIPNNCKLPFKSSGEGAQCLGKKTVHVLGDNNVRR